MAKAENELVVDQDLEFQRRDWTFERIGWWAMLALVVAAVAGAFGRGPVSDAEATSSDHSVRVEYERFERHGARTALTIFIRRDSVAGPAVSLWVDDEFLRAIDVEGIDPEPVREVSIGDRTLFDIAVASDSARVTLTYLPRDVGKQRLRLGVLGRESVSISQFVYP